MGLETFIEKLSHTDPRRPFLVTGKGLNYGEYLKRIEVARQRFQTEGYSGKVVLFPIHEVADALVDVVALALERAIIAPYYGTELDSNLLGLAKADASEQYPLINQLKTAGKAGIIISTTGTTGRPKWVLHDLESLFSKYLKLNQKHVVPFIYKLDNVSGIELFISIASAGGTLVLPPSIAPEQLSQALESAGTAPDLLSMTPSYLRMLLMSWIPEVFAHVRQVNLGGERLLAGDLEIFQQALPRAQIHSFYGTTETSSIKTDTFAGTHFVKWGEEGVDFKVSDGELFLRRKPYHMLGYLFERDQGPSDWYGTGDLVKERNMGYYEVVGRRDAQFNVGSKKVDPAQVVAVLLDSGVATACKVRSEPNALLGNIVVAEVVAPEGKEIESQLRRHAIQALPEHARPMKYVFLKSFELNHRLKGFSS